MVVFSTFDVTSHREEGLPAAPPTQPHVEPATPSEDSKHTLVCMYLIG